MDYSNTSQQPPVEKKETSLTEHASNAWSGFTKMFEKSDSNPNPNPSASKEINITIVKENVNLGQEAVEKEDLIHVVVASKYVSI